MAAAQFNTEDFSSEENISLLFRLTMWLRIFYGLVRMVLGLELLRVVGEPLVTPIRSLFSHEITSNLSDVVLSKLYAYFEANDLTVTYFIAGYLIFWGTIEVFLSWALLKQVKVAFPIAMVLIVLFIGYAALRFTYTQSPVLGGIILLDLFILYLINHEYKRLKEGTIYGK